MTLDKLFKNAKQYNAALGSDGKLNVIYEGKLARTCTKAFESADRGAHVYIMTQAHSIPLNQLELYTG